MKKRIGYGTFAVNSVSVLKECIKQAVLSGYDFIDTAYIYQNEEAIGKAIKELRQEGFDNRILIQTKIWPDFYGNVEDAILMACQKLQVQKLDMCLLHRRHFNLNMDISAWEQLIECKRKGLVDEMGVSNYDRDALEIMRQRTNVYPISNQIELSVNNYREDRVVYNQSKNIEIQAWSPLGDIENNVNNPVLIEMANKYNTDVAGILVAFIGSLNHSIIVKTSNPQRVISNIKSFGITLEQEDIEKLRKLNTYKIKYSESYPYDINK